MSSIRGVYLGELLPNRLLPFLLPDATIIVEHMIFYCDNDSLPSFA